MRGGLVVVVCVAGCGFQPGRSSSSTIDASTHGSDARLPDGKLFQDAPAVAGSIAVDVLTEGATDINLTTEGTTDWAHWGYLGATGFDRKTGGTAISNLTAAPPLAFTGAPLTSSWTDGTPHGVVTATTSGVACRAGASMTFTVPADTTSHTLRLYVGAQEAAARLDVSLSDVSAPAQSRTLTDMNGVTNVRYTITFNAARAGQALTVSWADTTDYGNQNSAFAALLSATLQ